MPEIKTEFLFTIALDVDVYNIGETAAGVSVGSVPAAFKDQSSRARCCRAAAG